MLDSTPSGHSDPRDQALQRTMPCVAVPRFGQLPAMDHTSAGMRLLVARSGVYVQVKLDWLEATVRVQSLPGRPALPYGDVNERIRFAFGIIPISLLEGFIEAGRSALPNEIAGALIFSRQTGSLRLTLHDAIEAGPNGVRYRLPHLQADESLAVDLHTHGHGAAFWSPTDDADDQGIKVAGVFGNLDVRRHERPSAAFRLVINGLFKRLVGHPWAVSEHSHQIEETLRCPTLDSLGFLTVQDAMEDPSSWNTTSMPPC